MGLSSKNLSWDNGIHFKYQSSRKKTFPLGVGSHPIMSLLYEYMQTCFPILALLKVNLLGRTKSGHQSREMSSRKFTKAQAWWHKQCEP